MDTPYRIGFQKSDKNPNGLDLNEYKYVFKSDLGGDGGKRTIGVNDFNRFIQEHYADRKSTRLNSSHVSESRMPSSA